MKAPRIPRPQTSAGMNIALGVIIGLALATAVATAVIETAPSRHAEKACVMMLKDGVGNTHEVEGPCKFR